MTTTAERYWPTVQHPAEEHLWSGLNDTRTVLGYRVHETAGAAPMEFSVEALLALWIDSGEHDLIDVLATFRADLDRAALLSEVERLLVLSNQVWLAEPVSREAWDAARVEYAEALAAFAAGPVTA